MAEHVEHQQIVALLDVDPDLGAGLGEDDLQLARRHAVASVLELEPSDWDTRVICERATKGWLGLFVVDGLLLRRVRVGGRFACELLAAGDLVRPWDSDADYEPLPISVDWIVLRRSRLAVLDTAFVIRCARWPTINGQIVARLAQRARSLALTQAVTHLPRANARLLILFWLLAERLGKVGPDGVHITLPVTHDVLAMLVGAHRPTVTVALQGLARAGLLIRAERDLWILTHRAIELLDHPEGFALIIADDDGGGDGSPMRGR